MVTPSVELLVDVELLDAVLRAGFRIELGKGEWIRLVGAGRQLELPLAVIMGESRAVIESLSNDARIAALDFAGFDAQLPPTVRPLALLGSAITLDFGNLALGTLDSRTVIAHGQAALVVARQSDAIALQGTLGDVLVNCIADFGSRRASRTWCHWPGLLRATARTRRTLLRFSGADLLAQLPALGVGRMRLHLSELRIRTDANPVGLELRVTAQSQ
jgi:hypothetical protein